MLLVSGGVIATRSRADLAPFYLWEFCLLEAAEDRPRCLDLAKQEYYLCIQLYFISNYYLCQHLVSYLYTRKVAWLGYCRHVLHSGQLVQKAALNLCEIRGLLFYDRGLDGGQA
jgi:hypothetical protein